MPSSPLAIVGTGGSGTRVFARLAEATGRSMGTHQNEANDAMALFRFADKWCRRVYPAWQAGEAVDRVEFRTDLESCLRAHLRNTRPGTPWGWKQPRSLYMLPAFAAVCPDIHVLHVVRDGRDIAFGKQFRLEVAGEYAVPAEADEEPTEVRLAMLWAGPNALAADFCESELGNRYLRLRLEDLCADPLTTAARLAAFSGGEEIAPERTREIVSVPAGLGRWREAGAEILARVTAAADESLRRFGYA